MEETFTSAAIAFLAIFMFSVPLIWFFVYEKNNIKTQQESDECCRRLEKLEDEHLSKRHTHPTANGIEDATAVLIDLVMHEEMNAEFRHSRLEAARKILGRVREGPHAYKDTPNEK